MIKNLTRKAIICNNKRILTSFYSKFIGLMFSLPISDTGLVFIFDSPKTVDLHMFFVFFPIDVLFLDEDKKVVEIKENFLPFTFYIPRNKAMYVIEMKAGIVRRSGTRVGDSVLF